MSRKVLILGATGAMGRYLTQKCVDAGYEVDGVCLEDVVSRYPNLKYIKAENAKSSAFVDELVKKHYDCVVDFMTYGSISSEILFISTAKTQDSTFTPHPAAFTQTRQILSWSLLPVFPT